VGASGAAARPSIAASRLNEAVTPGADRCSWCGVEIEREAGYRLGETPGARRAAFCRLEHVVPWFIQGPHWEAGEIDEPRGLDEAIDACAQCGRTLDDVRVLLVRHRGEHRVPDAFCSTEHLAEWARSGGRWRQP
jgi:hypothetical protein